MKKRKPVTSSRTNPLHFRYANLYWGALAACVWTGTLLWHGYQGTPFSPATWLKGLLLLVEATTLYQLSAFKGFSFLGMFPLLWISVSRFQFDICSNPEPRYWFWMLLFLACGILSLALPDGKKLLIVLTPLWGILSWLFPFSLLLPLSFATAPKGRFQRSGWVRWGGFAAAVVFFVYFRGWRIQSDGPLGLYDFMVSTRFIAFLFLGWLGLAAFPQKGIFRHVVFPLFLLTVGFIWTGLYPLADQQNILKWVLVYFAGFGWESFRRDLMDPSWHGRAVWFALGVAFFGGMF
ncbi:MAG TPA: hypothetical protein VMV05_08440 [bacterium]|nr:hypothetical protein [bacterium]